MKIFKGFFANGAEYMGVEVPENGLDPWIATNHMYCKLSTKGFYQIYYGDEAHFGQKTLEETHKILGLYYPGKGVEFAVPPEFVGMDVPELRDEALAKKCAMLALLDRDSRQKFPLDENPFGVEAKDGWWPNDGRYGSYSDYKKKWRESEEKVRPRCFVILICGG